jgi:hypothetical protein
MRHIDFKNKTPMDGNLPGWTPWSKAKWDEWLKASADLHAEADRLDAERKALEAAGDSKRASAKHAERNQFINSHSAHWGKLKPWLLKLSNGKCWFTDTTNNGSHYDVEHFRPKAEAKNLDGTVREGYWWLAFDYTNYRLAGGVPNTKKGGWFALCDGSPYSTSVSRCEESEVPYLLDPVKASDPLLLAFDEEGNAIPVPSLDNWSTEAGKWNKARAEESIKRYKLNDHDALPERRRKVWSDLTGAINEFLEAKAKFHHVRNPLPAETMEQAARRIEAFTRDDVEFSSVAKWCIALRNDPSLVRLI